MTIRIILAFILGAITMLIVLIHAGMNRNKRVIVTKRIDTEELKRLLEALEEDQDDEETD